MTRPAFEQHFSSLGMGDKDATSRAGLLRATDGGFRAALGARPEWLWFAPGRIEVFGKHTDYAGGRSLLCTVPRGIAVAARPRTDRVVRMVDLHDGQLVTIDPESQRGQPRGLENYGGVVARRLALNFPDAPIGADIAILSDLPRAAGVSSSSALVVGIAAALIRRGALDERPKWRENIASVQDRAWYLGCVENGLGYKALPGSSGVGTLGGSEDHTAILACRTGHVSQYRFVPVHHLGDVVMPTDWTFVVASSGVHADKAGGVRELYNRASRATQVLLDIWNQNASRHSISLGQALAADGTAFEHLADLVPDGDASGFTTDELRTRLRHFAREDRRIPEAALAFASIDPTALGRLAAESQDDADTLLGNQVPETRLLARRAVEAGAFAASSFGAGFGGSVWAAVERSEAERFAGDWLRAYRAAYPNLTKAEVFVAMPGPPLTELPVPE